MGLPFDPIEEAARQWRVHWGDEAPVPAMRAVTSIMRTQQLLLARLNEQLAAHGLTFARYEALVLLSYAREGCLPLGKMGARLQVHRTSVGSLVDGLVALGLVVRAPHPTDGRTTLVTITDAGRARARAATEDLHASAFGTAPLTDAELDGLSDVLSRFRAGADDFVAADAADGG